MAIKARMITTGTVKIKDGAPIEVMGAAAENMDGLEQTIYALADARRRIDSEIYRLKYGEKARGSRNPILFRKF